MAIWNLRTSLRPPKGYSTMQLELEAVSENGALSGTITYAIGMPGEGQVTLLPADGAYNQAQTTYTVSGSWMASYSDHQPDKKYTVFTFAGNDGAELVNEVAAVGTVDGPGDAPTGMTIAINAVSAQYGTLSQDVLRLRPASADDDDDQAGEDA